MKRAAYIALGTALVIGGFVTLIFIAAVLSVIGHIAAEAVGLSPSLGSALFPVLVVAIVLGVLIGNEAYRDNA